MGKRSKQNVRDNWKTDDTILKNPRKDMFLLNYSESSNSNLVIF